MCDAPWPKWQRDLGLSQGVVMDAEGFQPYSTVGISLMSFL